MLERCNYYSLHDRRITESHYPDGYQMRSPNTRTYRPPSDDSNG